MLFSKVGYFSITWHRWINFSGPAINPATQRLHLFKTLVAQPNSYIQGTDAGMTHGDNMGFRIQLLKGTRRDFSHRHALRPTDLRSGKFPRLTNIQQNRGGALGFQVRGQIAWGDFQVEHEIVLQV